LAVKQFVLHSVRVKLKIAGIPGFSTSDMPFYSFDLTGLKKEKLVKSMFYEL